MVAAFASGVTACPLTGADASGGAVDGDGLTGGARSPDRLANGGGESEAGAACDRSKADGADGRRIDRRGRLADGGGVFDVRRNR